MRRKVFIFWILFIGFALFRFYQSSGMVPVTSMSIPLGALNIPSAGPDAKVPPVHHVGSAPTPVQVPVVAVVLPMAPINAPVV
jgi:hypothetical protein